VLREAVAPVEPLAAAPTAHVYRVGTFTGARMCEVSGWCTAPRRSGERFRLAYAFGMDDTPEAWPGPSVDPAEAEEITRTGRISNDLRRQMNPSPRLGVATEDSIEDPFTGQITVTVQLD
jgi:hypothetical protein